MEQYPPPLPSIEFLKGPCTVNYGGCFGKTYFRKTAWKPEVTTKLSNSLLCLGKPSLLYLITYNSCVIYKHQSIFTSWLSHKIFRKTTLWQLLLFDVFTLFTSYFPSYLHLDLWNSNQYPAKVPSRKEYFLSTCFHSC